MVDRKKLFIRIALFISFIFIVNSIAVYFHWYSSLWWFDMIMHFLGGAWLGLFFLWLFRIKNISTSLFFRVILSVFIVSLLWEVYEIVVNDQIAKNIFDYQDSVSDLFFDLSGSFTALFYFILRIMRNTSTAV